MAAQNLCACLMSSSCGLLDAYDRRGIGCIANAACNPSRKVSNDMSSGHPFTIIKL